MYRDLLKAIADSFERIADDYAGHEGEVAALIEQCQRAIEDDLGGAPGPWERREMTMRARRSAPDGCAWLSLPPKRRCWRASCHRPNMRTVRTRATRRITEKTGLAHVKSDC
jgi:hypothetical protein